MVNIILWCMALFFGSFLHAANFPTAVCSDSNLFVAKNNCGTTLSSSISSSTGTISVVSASCFPSVGYITIDSEAILYSGKTATTFTGCSRGSDGTSAASHTAGAHVYHTVVAAHHNVLKDELIAISTTFLQGSQFRMDFANTALGIGTASPIQNYSLTTAAGITVGQNSHSASWNFDQGGIHMEMPFAKATTSSGGSGLIKIFSNDDHASVMQGTFGLVTKSTPALRRVTISAIEQGTAFRDVAINQDGGNVVIGSTMPAATKLHVVGTDGLVKTFPTIGARDFFVLENNGNVNMNIIGSSTTGTSEIKWTPSAGSGARGAILYSFPSNYMAFTSSGTEAMRIDSLNYVGIGMSPQCRVDVEGVNDITGGAFKTALRAKSSSGDKPGIILGTTNGGDAGIIAAATNATGQPIAFWTFNGSSWGERARITAAGNVGIGVTPTERLHIKDTSSNLVFLQEGASKTFGLRNQTDGAYGLFDYTANAWRDLIDTSGDRIWLSTAGVERVRILNSGAVRMSAYGAGTATFDASGNITSVSDERLKIKQGTFRYGLAEVLQIEPILFKWKPDSGLEKVQVYPGFSAQNIRDVIPEAATPNKDGFLSLQDRGIIGALVNAVKELDARIKVLENKAAQGQSPKQ